MRITKPYLQFDPNDDLFEPFSNWRVHLQNWTDLNGDGQFWIDANGNGKVDLGGEMQTGEHMRFSYGYNTGPTQQVRISNPLERIDDGLLMSLRHRNEVASVPTTDIIIERSYWARRNWSWVKTSRKQLKVPAGGDASFTASIKIPPNTPYGMYEGEILLAGQGSEVVIPVTIAVAAEGTSMQFGETNYKNGQASLYDNENVFGYTDYSWRAESGDWRFYFLDIPEGSIAPSGQTLLVVDNSWAGNSTDIDTIILGPSADGFPSATYGPYTLDIIGRSEISYIGSGRWGYQTSSGGPREIVATPLTAEGLHAILLHQVKVDGSALDDQFGGKTGRAVVTPGEVAASGPAGPGSATVTIESELALENFVAQGFGFGSEVTTVESVNQDDPNDPSTASFSISGTTRAAS